MRSLAKAELAARLCTARERIAEYLNKCHVSRGVLHMIDKILRVCIKYYLTLPNIVSSLLSKSSLLLKCLA